MPGLFLTRWIGLGSPTATRFSTVWAMIDHSQACTATLLSLAKRRQERWLPDRIRRFRQEASSQVMIKITGTESTVAAKIMSRAKITPRS